MESCFTPNPPARAKNFPRLWCALQGLLPLGVRASADWGGRIETSEATNPSAPGTSRSTFGTRANDRAGGGERSLL